MRVAVISESFLPTLNGVTTSVRKVLDYLHDRGDEAIVIVPAAGAPRKYHGFRVHEVPAIAYRQFPVGLPSGQVHKLIADFRPDVIHAASPFLLGAQAISAGRRLGVPSVAVFQTDVARYAKRNHLGATAKFAWRVIRWVHDDADLTLVPSSASMADLEQAGVEPLFKWGRGVDLNTYHPDNRARPNVQRLRRALAPHGETIIGYVGRFAPEKQIERLAVLRGFAGIRLALVGDGPGMASVRRALAGMPVHYLGTRTGDELAAAYASFDMFVHTGSEETFGQTLQEAHASGLAVLAPRAGGPVDLVRHGRTGFLYDPHDDRDLKRFVALLASDDSLRSRLGEAGRRSVLGRSWEAVCFELIGYYQLAIAARMLDPELTLG